MKNIFFFSVFMGLVTVAPAFAKTLKIVPNKDVCMVTDMHFNKAQIPVEVEGKTYYGCCQNCKKTLTEDAKVRTAEDPVSHKPVDKATATIAVLEDGSVLYFENKQNVKKYKAN